MSESGGEKLGRSRSSWPMKAAPPDGTAVHAPVASFLSTVSCSVASVGARVQLIVVAYTSAEVCSV